MASKRVLLLGGHGKVSLLLTPHLIARSWHVTSVIRDPTQTDDILSTVKGDSSNVDVLVSSLEDVKSKGDAQQVIDKVKPDYVVWSAGMFSFGLLWYVGGVADDPQAPAVKEPLHARRPSTVMLVSTLFKLQLIQRQSPSSCWSLTPAVGVPRHPGGRKRNG